MKKCKRFVSLVLALALVFTCAITASAYDASSAKDVQATTARVQENEVGFETGKTSTSVTSGDFFIGSASRKANLKVRVWTAAPCTFYIRIKDENGKSLGVSSLTITKTQDNAYTMIPSPSQLSGGSYRYEIWFNKPSISYYFIMTATF